MKRQYRTREQRWEDACAYDWLRIGVIQNVSSRRLFGHTTW
jgi:hypothetical protein